ncbi:lactonase family protein [Novosphingobium flavum]|uniref:Lactonase family protein n=1 Tax=Novosphingobium flavum TaxID=1778672 RepID=A0A7X1FT93_9SPHN|nr:lactonase family protein [Novosphingobium flavum]
MSVSHAAPGGTFVYVAQNGARQISVLRMAPENGALTWVEDVPASGNVQPMTVSPDRRFLYASLRSEPFSVASFMIDGGTGKLTHMGDTPAYESMVNIALDRTGRFLLGANNPKKVLRTGNLTVAPIGPQGFVQLHDQMVRTPPKLHSVQVDPSNRFILGASCDGDAIIRHAFDAATGELSLEPLTPVMVEPGRGPRHIRFHPSGRFFYVVNEYDASVVVFRYIPQSGMLAEVQIVDAKPEGYVPGDRRGKGISAAGADLHFTPNGRWLFVSVRGSFTIAVFAVDPATGRLTVAGHFPAPAEPRGLAVDPLGRYLLAAGDVANNLVVHRIDGQSGALEVIDEYPMGDGPNWIECVRLP